MIWACSRCKRPCIEVYPVEDKTVIYRGHCPECYIIARKERNPFLEIETTSAPPENNTVLNRYLPTIIPFPNI